MVALRVGDSGQTKIRDRRSLYLEQRSDLITQQSYNGVKGSLKHIRPGGIFSFTIGKVCVMSGILRRDLFIKD